MINFKDDLIKLNGNVKREIFRKIEHKGEGKRKYILDIYGFVYEADGEKDILEIIIKNYKNATEQEQLNYRMDLARVLVLYGVIMSKNINIVNESKRTEEIYYYKPDMKIYVDNEFTLFKSMNKLGYASIYYRENSGEYRLF